MGTFEKLKGKLKQVGGDLADDPDLHREGQAQEAKGEAEEDAIRARTEAAGRESEAAIHEARQRAAERRK
jgi:uncharacterized protein YjbJ (UPF0337 family)